MTVEILSTDRLVLRSVAPTDFDRLYDIAFSDRNVMSQAFAGKSLDRKEARNFFSARFDHDGNGRQIGVLELNNAGIVIGFAGLLACDALAARDYEIGFVLGQEFWGKGFATEIGLAQIEYGLETLGCERLLALVAPGNAPSIAVLQKIGMTWQATIETGNRGSRLVYIVHRGGREEAG